MKQLWIAFVLFSESLLAQQSPDSVLQMLVAREQKQADAIALGDKAIWDDALHDSVIIHIEDGSFISKKKFLDELRPLPAAYKGTIKIIEPNLKQYANTAVLSFIDDEYLDLYGQHIHTQYRQTDTWLFENGRWKIIAMQIFEIPKNPPAVSVSTTILTTYAGNYKLSDDRKAVVKVENGKLFVTKNNGAPVELFGETNDVFFRKGDGRVRVLFIKDSAGKFRMIERRAGEDLVWTQ